MGIVDVWVCEVAPVVAWDICPLSSCSSRDKYAEFVA